MSRDGDSPFLERPPGSLTQWTAVLAGAPIPVRAQTIAGLRDLLEQPDRINAHDIARVCARDPMMVTHVLAGAAALRQKRATAEITTVEEAVALFGVLPFLERFVQAPSVESRLAAFPDALLGLMGVLDRAVAAADYAEDWAVRRHDVAVERITIAALLHDLAEMLLWCMGPRLALRIEAMKRVDPHLRSAVAQHAVLGIELDALQLELVRRWNLPELMVQMLDCRHAQQPRVRNVLLAVNLARHAARGWGDPALPDDFRAIAELLQTTPAAVRELVGAAPASTAA
jgi:HD-like signal output (HDOD) protein